VDSFRAARSSDPVDEAADRSRAGSPSMEADGRVLECHVPDQCWLQYIRNPTRLICERRHRDCPGLPRPICRRVVAEAKRSRWKTVNGTNARQEGTPQPGAWGRDA